MHTAENLDTFTSRISWNLWSSASPKPQELSRYVHGSLYL